LGAEMKNSNKLEHNIRQSQQIPQKNYA